MALMLLPYWTDGCIGSMEGLFFESTATVPFHFVNQSELSVAPSRPMRGLPYSETDLDSGVRHLQLMGARYYMAFSEDILTEARTHPDLELVASSEPWEIFEISDAPLVEPLEYEPVVVEGADKGREAWLEVALPFYTSGEWEAFPASDGPDGWARVASLAGSSPASVEPAHVSNLHVDGSRITFEVDRTGSPVLVKTSYFPNWKVDGAQGPYRVAPNFMVVVPTTEEIELRYGYTAADILGWILTAIGVAGMFVMAGRPIIYRERRKPFTGVTPSPVEQPALAGIGLRSALRRFGAVTLAVTSLDIFILVALRLVTGMPVIFADAISISVAAVASYLIHRSISFADDPHVRWVRDPSTFIWIALLAGLVDVGVLRVAVQVFGSTEVLPLVASKAVALGVAGAVRIVAYRSRLFLEVREEQAHPAERPPPPGAVRLSVVLPAFGDAGRIGSSIGSVREVLAGIDDEVEVIVVDDGSSDATAEAAAEAGADEVIRLPHNQGKGAAVRAGVLAARGRTIVFTDSDLSYPPEQIVRVLEEVEAGWDLVVGSRKHHDTSALVKSGRLRALGGRIYNSLTRAVLLGQYRDTQCGLKGFRSDAAVKIFSKTRLDGFAFDVEVFHLAERYRMRLKEVPVALMESPTSTVRYALDAVRMVRDLFRIRHWAGQGLYDPAPAVQAQEAEVPEASEATPLFDFAAWVDRGGLIARIFKRLRPEAVDRKGTAWTTAVGVAIAVGIALWITRDVWGPLPPAGIDVMGHLVRTEFGIDLLSAGRLDGWFPRFMVGHQMYLINGPGFTWLVGVIKALSLGTLSVPTAFKIAVVASFALLPVAVAYAARSFGLDRRSAGLAGILSLMVSVPYGIGINGLFGTGLIPHQVGAVLFGFTLGAVLRVVDEPTVRRVAVAVVFGALLVVTHLLSVAALAVMLPFALAMKLAGTKDLWRPIGALVAAGIALGGAVAFWLLPFLAHSDLRGPATGFAHAGLEDRLAQILRGDLVFGPRIGWLVLGAAAVAFIAGVRGWRPGIVVSTLPAFYMLFAHMAHAIWPGDVTLPLTTRGIGYAALLSVLPLAWLLGAPGRWWGSGAFAASAAAAAALVLLPLGSLAEVPRQFPDAVPEMDLAAKELARVVPDGARFAFARDFPAEINNSGVVHPDTWLTYYSGRDSLNIFVVQSSASSAGFVTEDFRDKPLEESWQAMTRFGTTHVVVSSEEMVSKVEGSALFEPVWQEGPLAIYSVQPPAGQPPPGALLSSDKELSAELLEPGPDHIRIAFESSQAQLATVALGYSPKWKAEIDGRSHPLRRSADGLLELDIPAGEHRLDLSFGLDGWDWAGRGITLLALAGGAVIVVRRGRRREEAPAEVSAS
jgi:putative flippase GtrA